MVDRNLLKHLHDILVPFRMLAQEMGRSSAPQSSLPSQQTDQTKTLVPEGHTIAYGQAMDLVEQYLGLVEKPLEFCQWTEVWARVQNILQLAYPQAMKRLICRAHSWHLMPLQERHLQRIMLNLVTNGIESMGKTGSCEVICLDRPFEQDLSCGAVFIQIKNDIGQKGSKPAGYGLGLEIVQELVKNAGGRTRIYSQASRFVVEIEIPEFSYSKMPRVQERA